MGSNPLPDTFFSIKSKDFYKEKFIEMINLKPKEQIKPRKIKKRIFLIGHSYTTVLGSKRKDNFKTPEISSFKPNRCSKKHHLFENLE